MRVEICSRKSTRRRESEEDGPIQDYDAAAELGFLQCDVALVLPAHWLTLGPFQIPALPDRTRANVK